MYRATRLTYRLSTQRHRNFFEINPIYPRVGEHEYKLYGKERKRITALEYLNKNTRKKVSKIIKMNEMFRTDNSADNRTLAQRIIVDAQTHLPYGLGFDSYIHAMRAGQNIKKVNKGYKETIMKLMKKFNAKSAPELLKYFRIAMADLRKDDIRQRIKGTVVKNLVMEAAKGKQNIKMSRLLANPNEVLKNKFPVFNKQALEEQAFYEALAEIDKQIAEIEQKLDIFNRSGLDKYDPNFKKHEEIEYPLNEDQDILYDRIPQKVYGMPANLKNPAAFQDYVIQARISRLYFLKKLQRQTQQDGSEEEDENTQELINITRELRHADIVGFGVRAKQIARKYNIQQFVPTQSTQDIYKEIEVFVDSMTIGVKQQSQPMKEEQDQTPAPNQWEIMQQQQANTRRRKPRETGWTPEHTAFRKIFGVQNRRPEDMLWKNLDVDEIFDPQLVYKHSGIEIQDEQKHPLEGKHLDLDGNNLEISVSPNPDIEVSLNSVPYNLYKHSEYQIFGLYKDHALGDINIQNADNYLFDKVVNPNLTYQHFEFEEPVVKPSREQPQIPPQKHQFYGKGKRKSCFAICRIRAGTGLVKINRKSIRDYFYDVYDRVLALKPLVLCGLGGRLDIDFFVGGSGFNAQGEACAQALALAISKFKPEFKSIFRKGGLVSFDLRRGQRKHSGRYRARKGYTYVRR